ncbi:SCO family protein [Psychroflexus maritimus]|uniref:SCO family protein n=1 Tax=Psychroflexus maritimus TaxID=2714865 RepID=A0A967AG29_9FLAO|nr:SCO family protein [Psychroflexus maritimus]NGZ88785.1 SCO family protein [Psychroflexus maritimus]
MKNYSYIGISFIVLVFGIWAVNEFSNRASANELAYLTVQDDEGNEVKRKVPEFSFTNHKGETITHEDYQDKVYVVEFFFATCPTICPIMNENLVEVQNEFYGNMNFGIASFTINPEHDTPEVLNKYREKYGIQHPHWHLLTGDRNQIYELARNGFNAYAAEDKNAPGGFEHSGFFALVDKKGYLRSRHDEHGNPILYYQGAVPLKGDSNPGDEEQISILIEDIKKLL